MIAILTDKPNVGKEIARILGAHTREDGYMSGNGYMVTWTFGNMLSLAMPKDYGMDRPERGDFPINPAPFRLMVKHIRTDTGWIPDINAVLQLKVIEKVFDACESIIAATDASREGEMVFRYLYRYLECRKPYRRLWISSLTDEAVLEGMDNLRPGSLYDRMFLAADSRNKADWVLGLNASYALCQATGTGNNSLGRVQSKYSINSLVYWVTYVHNVVYSFYRSMIYCYINSTQRCAGSIEIDIIPTNGADKRKFSPFAPYFPVTNVIKRYFYPYFPAIIGIKGYSFPYFPYLSGIMKIKTALYSLFSRLDWHKTVVFPCLGEIYEGIRSLSWEIPVT